jgi:hypothetical protein
MNGLCHKLLAPMLQCVNENAIPGRRQLLILKIKKAAHAAPIQINFFKLK